MSAGTTQTVEVVRALTVTVIAVAVAAGGHVLGGGGTSALGPLIAIGAVLLVGARHLARSSLRTRTLLPWAIGAQVTVHMTLSWLTNGHSAGLTIAGHHGVEAASAGAHHMAAPSATMVIAHVVATLVTVLMLVGIDRAVGKTNAWWRTLTLLTADAPAAPVRRTAHRPSRLVGRPRVRRPGTDLVQRGPPFGTRSPRAPQRSVTGLLCPAA